MTAPRLKQEADELLRRLLRRYRAGTMPPPVAAFVNALGEAAFYLEVSPTVQDAVQEAVTLS